MGGAVFPPGSLTYGRDNDDLQKDLCLNPCIQYSGHASMGDSWTLTGKSGSVSCGVTAPFSWVLVSTRTFVCAFQESVSPVVWKFYNQIPLASKVKVPGGSQFLCRISTLGNLLWTIELSEQCKSFFAIIVLQFVGCLLSGSVVGLTRHTSQVCCRQSPCPQARPLLTRAFAGDNQTLKCKDPSLLWDPWILVHTRLCLCPPRACLPSPV